MYEEEYRTLLSLIAPVVGGKAGPCVVKDPKLLCQLAKKHSVSNLLYAATRDRADFPAECRAALERELFASAHQQLLQETAATRLFSALREAGIPFLPMKGVVMRSLYPAPEMRISCDVDVLYDKSRRGEVDALMKRLGYAARGSDPNHDEYTLPPCVSVEMHRNLLTDFPTVDAYYQDVWARLVPVGGSEYRMTDEDFYIYQTVHTMKHFTTAGTGIRSVLDVFVYRRARPTLDRARLEGELRRLRLLDFHLTLERLAEAWFGGEEMTEDLVEVSDYILGSGTYGQATQQATNRAAKARGGKLGYLLFRAFPPFGWMAEKHPVLRRAPILLPWFWLLRLLRGAFGREKRIDHELRAVRRADRAEARRLDAVMGRVGLRDYR